MKYCKFHVLIRSEKCHITKYIEICEKCQFNLVLIIIWSAARDYFVMEGEKYLILSTMKLVLINLNELFLA